MEYTIKTLKEEINKLNINNDNLTLLGISSMNEPNELFNPYILYIYLNNKPYSINVSCDLVMLHEFESTEQLIEELNLNSAYRCFVKKENIENNINKKSPIVNALLEDFEFDKYTTFWTDEFAIIKKKGYFAVFTSDDFEETSYNKLIEKITETLNIHNVEKLTDYKRLTILGYDSRQINEIIKSKSIIDIEPYINSNTPAELMKHYNKIGKEIDEKDKEIFINCIRIKTNIDFLLQPYTKEQKEEIFMNLLNGSKVPSFLTPEYSTEKISAIFSVLSTNEDCTDFSPKYSTERIHIMKNKKYNIICDKVKDMDIENIRKYLLLLEKYKDIPSELFIKYINKQYNNEQLSQIYSALNDKMTEEEINIFSSPKFSAEQMFLIKKALECISTEKMYWVTPDYTPQEILEISNRILKNKKIDKFLKTNENLEELIKKQTNNDTKQNIVFNEVEKE